MMTPTSLRLFLALAAAAAVVAVVLLPDSIDARAGMLLGGWSPIKNLSDPHVREIADFAVKEYNKQSKAALVLQSVVSGETQVVSGTNYRLILTAKDGATVKAAAKVNKEASRYQAEVWEKVWENYRNLTSFKPVKA